jgi:mono/diheme cytochrome c family protein
VRSLLVLSLLFSLVVVGSAQRASDSARSTKPSQQTPPRTPRPAPAPAGFETIVKPFLAQNCFTCHGKKKQENDLNLQAFDSSASLVEHREQWDEVVGKLRRGEMPPLEEEQPPEDQRQAVAAWLARELNRIDAATPPDPGRVTARRLNRTEYNNTIKELLGVDLRPADDFPQDDAGYGFDNIADVLSLSPVLMEKYVTAADRVARLALFGPPAMEPTLIRLRSEGRKVVETRTIPASYDVTGLSLPNAFHAMHRVPVEGDYMVRVVLGGLRPKGSNAVTVALWVDNKQIQIATHDQENAASFSTDRQDFGGQAVQMKIRMTAGDHLVSVAIPLIYEGLPASVAGPNPSTRPEAPVVEFTPPANVPPERLEQLRKRFEDAKAEVAKIPFNGVRVNAVEIGGPYSYAKGPSRASLEKVYTCGHLDGHHVATCTPRIMTDLARRAFRRPVTTREVEKYIALAQSAQKEERSFEEGLTVGIQAILVSPDFLFRLERERPGTPSATAYKITPHELATRLSYFLWASMPDTELRRAADTGTLRDPQILAFQVRRMLRDPRAHALAEQFGGQWLQFRALESLTRDRDKFPEFEDYLRLSMRRETELFVETIIRSDRSVLDFINGRYSFLNERLARHYGIPNVVGPEFRQVDLTATPRGGVLTQGSVLAVSSYATRTSPVLRGKWVLDNLLNAPPPEPPADVPNLDETKIGTAASMREQLEEHRKNAICASCHRRMDPLGFGLENFDAVGAWRTMEGKFPIDASGQLPDGRRFSGPDELRTILSADRDAFARAITSKLLTYGLGRGLERYDTRTIKLIASRLPSYDYKFSGLVLEIVNSLPFQSRRSPAPGDRTMTKPTAASSGNATPTRTPSPIVDVPARDARKSVAGRIQ